MTQLEQFHKEKDDFFAFHPQSPLTSEQKKRFTGLKYFPENSALVFEVNIEKFPQQQEIRMQTSTGEVQTYRRYGRFQFTVNHQPVELTIYERDHEFFLPFADALAGNETYGAGRYLEPRPLSKNKFAIDFNYAYNPYCAYNARWSCPVPPAENRLRVPIRAGEKVFEAHL